MREDNKPGRLFEKPANLRFYISEISGHSDHFANVITSVRNNNIFIKISVKFISEFRFTSAILILLVLSVLTGQGLVKAEENTCSIMVNYAANPKTPHYETWKDGRLVFRNEKFKDLAVRLEKWFGVKIVILNPKLREVKITGLFENETIVQVLEALKIAVPFEYKINNKEILIY